jgi:hypothetical protein
MPNEQTTDGARRLARLLIAEPDPAACERCLDALEAYCAAQIAGGDPALPEVTSHLDSCVACSESYALMYESLLVAANLPEPASYPQPNLAFLKRESATPVSGRTLSEVLALAVERAGGVVRLRLSQLLLDLLPPPTALALRSGAAPLMEIMISAPGELVEGLTAAALPEADPLLCTLSVRVAIAEREWPDLEGIAVRLSVGDVQRQASTDVWGEALFAQVPRAALSSLQIEVEA